MNKTKESKEEQSQEELHRVRILNLISGSESRLYYTFIYATSFIFFYLILQQLEPGILAAITGILAILSFAVWLYTNPWLRRLNVYIEFVDPEAEDLIHRNEIYMAKAKKFGIASYVYMAAASWFFIW